MIRSKKRKENFKQLTATALILSMILGRCVTAFAFVGRNPEIPHATPSVAIISDAATSSAVTSSDTTISSMGAPEGATANVTAEGIRAYVPETSHFGTVTVTVCPGGSAEGEQLLTVSEVTKERDPNTYYGVLGALQDVRTADGAVLGDLVLDVNLQPEGETVETEAEYSVTLALPEDTADTEVYEMSEDGAPAILLDSNVEEDAESAIVTFTASGNAVLALEFLAEPKEAEDYGYRLPEKNDGEEVPAGDINTEPNHAYEGLTGAAGDLPSAYSSVQEGYVPQVRDQTPYGTCWAFSTLAAAETDMVSHGYSTAAAVDLSEAALAYYMYHKPADPLGLTAGDGVTISGRYDYREGGNAGFAIDLLSGWAGATAESDAPYSWLTNNEAALEDGGTALCYDDAAILVGSSVIDTSQNSNYAVKQAVMDHGAVVISYYHNTGYERMSDGQLYYYYPNTTGALDSNHAVSVVGWDDDVNSSLFKSRPSSDGAWLVRNSWGSTYGDGGYFWLSYEDGSVDVDGYSVTMVPADTYEHNYHYDGGVGNYSGYLDHGQKAANMFRVSGSEGTGQSLEAVSIKFSLFTEEYSIDVYTSTEPMENPESGVHVAHLDGTDGREGYSTIPLPTPVLLEEGQYFSVVFTAGTSGGGLCFDKDEFGNWYTSVNATHVGESFKNDGSGWMDLDAEDPGHGRTPRIKAFTSDVTQLYTVTFDTNGGDPASLQQQVASGDCVAEPTGITHGTDAVEGWYTDTGLTQKWDFETDRVGADMTLFAKWVEACTVDFETNGGTPAPAVQYVAEGWKVREPAGVHHEGDLLEGWYTDAGFTRRWDYNSDVVTEDMRLYAKWTTLREQAVLSACPGDGVLKRGNAWIDAEAIGTDKPDRICFIDCSEGPQTVDGTWLSDWRASGDDSVRCYLVFYEGNVTLYVAFNEPEGKKAHTGASIVFDRYSPAVMDEVSRIDGLELLDASALINANNMFYGMSSLQEIDLSFLADSGLVSMDGMFYGCDSLYTVTICDGFHLSQSVLPEVNYFRKKSINRSIDGRWYSVDDPETSYLAEEMSSAPAGTYRAMPLSTRIVSFDSNGGSAVARQYIVPGDAAKEPDGVTHGTDAIEGWYTDGELTRKWNFGRDTVDADMTLYAKWTAGYSVTFITGGGTPEPLERYVVPGSRITEPEGIRCYGDLLEGWYTDAGFTQRWDCGSDVVTEDVKLYARWITLSGQTVLSACPGDGVLKSGNSWIGVGNILWDRPGRICFLNCSEGPQTVDGTWRSDWCASEDGSVWCYLVGQEDNRTLYVAFNEPEGGKAHTQSSFVFADTGSAMEEVTRIDGLELLDASALTAADGLFYFMRSLQEIDLCFLAGADLTSVDRMFLGCNSLETVDLSGVSIFPSTSVNSMFSGCDRLYTVTIGAEFHPSQTVLPGATGARKQAIHESIDGRWYSVEEPEVSYSASQMNNAPAGTYRAMPRKRTVAFDSNGGTAVATGSVYPGRTVARPGNPTRKGYTFRNWYLGKTVYDFATAVTQDIILKAKWTPVKYSIKFSANGGTGTMKSQSRKYDDEAALTSNAFKRTGYTFTGWNTKSDGSGTAYANKSTDNIRSKTGTTTLYAQWKKNTYRITYDLDGGTNSKSNPASYTVTTSTITLKNPKKTGYTFEGWYVSTKYKTKVTSIPKGSAGTKKFYAKWKKNTYTVTYQLNGGTNSKKNPASYTVTSSTVTLKKPTRKGYTFVGWYSDSKYKTKVTEIRKGSTGNKTLYARWKKK